MTRLFSHIPLLPAISLLLGMASLLDAASLEDLTYTADNAQITVTKCNGLAEGSLEVPALIEGLPVTAIGANCFLDCSLITSVTLPAGLTSIGSSAFQDSGLQSINFPSSLKQIGAEAFSGTHLTHVVLPDLDYFGYKAFKGCYELRSVKMAGSGPYLQGEAFMDCFRLSEVTLADDLMSIGDRAFAECLALTRITIPKAVTSIGTGAFQNCALKKVKMLSGRDIGEDAFAGNHELTEVVFPPYVDRIGRRAFDGCPLGTIEIPSGPSYVGDRAFNNYSGPDPSKNPLTKIYFLRPGWAPLFEGRPFGPAVNPEAKLYYGYGSLYFKHRWGGVRTEVISTAIRVEDARGKALTKMGDVLAFKPRKVGTASAPETIRFTNVGNYRLPFLGATLRNEGRADYSMPKALKRTLEPGESVVVNVRFSPKETGYRYGYVRFSYFNTFETYYEVRLAGTGTK